MCWISTSGMLIRELQRLEDAFITVRMPNGEEYVIDSIGHALNYTDCPASHLCLNIRDGGQCEIRR